MSKPTCILVAHMGHDALWLQIKTRKEIEDRIAYIKEHKPKRERPLRLKLLKIVEEPLPPKLAEGFAAREKAYAAWVKADAAWEKAYAAREKAHAAWWKADAAWWKANAAWWEADAARQKAYAAWEKIINSPEGVAFHKQVCGCAWTPEQPDILLQLIAAQREG